MCPLGSGNLCSILLIPSFNSSGGILPDLPIMRECKWGDSVQVTGVLNVLAYYISELAVVGVQGKTKNKLPNQKSRKYSTQTKLSG